MPCQWGKNVTTHRPLKLLKQVKTVRFWNKRTTSRQKKSLKTQENVLQLKHCWNDPGLQQCPCFYLQRFKNNFWLSFFITKIWLRQSTRSFILPIGNGEVNDKNLGFVRTKSNIRQGLRWGGGDMDETAPSSSASKKNGGGLKANLTITIQSTLELNSLRFIKARIS